MPGPPAARRLVPRGARWTAAAAPALAGLLVLGATTACSRLAQLDGSSASTATPAPMPVSRQLTSERTAGDCDNQQASCQLLLDPGALPRHSYRYALSPGHEWWGTIERQQQCADPTGATHGEAVKATVHAVITAADAAGNIQMDATVVDVEVSDPSIDATTVLEFPLGARTSALFSAQGLSVRPLRPPTYAMALISPLPPGEVGIGARWEIQAPGTDTRSVRQLQLVADGPDGLEVHGLTGDWLDEARTRQQITGATSVQTTLRSVGPRRRSIEVAAGVGCFTGTPSGPVTYFVNQVDPPPGIEG